MSLSLPPDQIRTLISTMDPPPRVYMSSVTRIAEPEVQRLLRHLNIRVIALDECQVTQNPSLDSFSDAWLIMQVCDPDPQSGWSEILPYKWANIVIHKSALALL